MELTRFERRVMDSRYISKCKWYLLLPGLTFLAAGLFVIIYGYMRLPGLEAKWRSNMDTVSGLSAETEREQLLLNTAVHYVDVSRMGWVELVKEKTRLTAELFLMIGAITVGLYFRERKHKQLLEKLMAPNQAL